MTFPRPEDDEARIAYLRDLAILDTSRSENLDRITRLCQHIFSAPIAAITLLEEDRQWFKSIQGLDVCETNRDVAFCNYTIMSSELFEVTDASTDPTFQTNPLVVDAPNIRYYAGVPLDHEGHNLGALCILDVRARPSLDPTQQAILQNLGEMAVHELKVSRLLRQSLALVASDVEQK